MPCKVPLKGCWITDCKYLERAIRITISINGKEVDIASHEAGQVGWIGEEIMADVRVE